MSKESLKVAGIVHAAGGKVIGRTRLQKIAYLLTAAGFEDGFDFTYKHYGPYSEALANAARDANLLGYLTEVEKHAEWGGSYSLYRAEGNAGGHSDAALSELATLGAGADAIELELAATALYLANEEGVRDPWAETARRKPSKSVEGRLEKAKLLYQRISSVSTPNGWPKLAE